MISNIFRSLHLQWRLNAAVLLCMTLASAFLAITSGYARLVATDELQQSLEETSAAGRTLLITGNRYSFSDELSQRLGKILDQALKDQLVIRHAASEPEQPTVIAVAGHSVLVRTLDLYSFNLLADNVRVIEGRLPTQVRLNEATDSWRPPPIEAVIGLSTAKLSGYAIGDRVSGDKGYHRLDIVGIVEPLDRGDDLWGQDLSAFEILTGKDQADSEGIALPLIIASTSMQSNYPERPVFLHQVSWRVTMNRHLIDVDDVETLRSDLANLQTQSATIRARTETDLVGILADFQVRVSRLRTMITLLTAQALIFVFYALATVASSQVVRSQVELATLSGRGASVWQILLAYTAEKLILAMVAALLLGPGLAQGVLTLWGTGSGEFSPIGLAGEAWLLSGLAAVLGWFALILPAYSTVRKRSADEQSWRHRPPRQSLVQRRYLDLFLLVIGGLLTWQLHQTGSFLMQGVRETRLADPLLLTGPSLMLIAITMVFLRLLPILFHLAGQLVRPLRGVVLSPGPRPAAVGPAGLAGQPHGRSGFVFGYPCQYLGHWPRETPGPTG